MGKPVDVRISDARREIGLCKFLIVMLVCAVSIATAWAGTIYSYRQTPSGTLGFRSGYAWKDGKTPGPGNDYVVTNLVRCGQYASGHAGSIDDFGGDSLQIGVPNKNGILCYNSYGKVRVKHLILVNGFIYDGDGSSSTMTFDGGMTEVRQTGTTPFKYGNDNYRGFAFTNGHQFKGDENAAIRLDADDRNLSLGSGSPEYYGKMVLQCKELTLGAPDAFGGPRTEPTADAIKFERYGSNNETVTFDFSGDMTAPNRGITLSSGGSPTFTFPAGRVVRCMLPITGGSTLTANGEGTKWFGKVSTPNLKFAAGIGGCALFNGTKLTLGANAKFGVEVFSGGIVTPMTIAEGATLVTEGEKIPLHVYGILPLTNETTRIAVMKIPTSAKVVTDDDFVVTAEDLGLSTSLGVEVTEDDGVQTVWFVMTCGKIVYYSNYNANATFDQDGQYWSDGEPVHGDADYVIGYDVPDSCKTIAGVDNVAFGGKSLTFVRGATFDVKGRENYPTRVSDLRMWPGSKFHTAQPTYQNSFAGTVTFCGQNGDDPVEFVCGGNNNPYSYTIRAELKGAGPISFTPGCAAEFNVKFMTASPEFTGSITVNGNGSSRTYSFPALTSEEQLGGNPATFNAGQLYANTKLTLKATDTFAIDDQNRGITLANGAMTIDVAAGKTMTLDVPVVMNANIAKTGSGTLGIGGSYSGSARKFNVNAGRIMPVNRVGVENVVVALAKGTGLDLALYPASEDVKLDGYYVKDVSALTIADSALPVTVKGDFAADGESVKLGLLNVPSSMADAIATKIEGHVTFLRDGRKNERPLSVYRENLADDRVRFWTKIARQGLMIVVE